MASPVETGCGRSSVLEVLWGDCLRERRAARGGQQGAKQRLDEAAHGAEVYCQRGYLLLRIVLAR